jgi:class 3 adenylate cyclase/tetratricopeptide (TPR) repeat protein
VAEPAPAPSAPSAERRLVSVLFADLVGHTSFSEQRDSEDVRELLSRYFESARQVIERFGGTVEKFIGDAVMAVWGTPVAREDDAERAVRAALDLVAAVAALGGDIGVAELRARAAVLTGEAAVTIGVEGQGMVAGDIVNAASRVQSLAAPGTVLVGERTRRATEAAIAYEDAGTHELKGKSEPVSVWCALRVIAARRGGGRAVGLEAPFVGRDAELRLVKELFHSAAEEKRARLVSVIGVAGVGKSRLAWEFEKYLDGLVDDVWWHRGRCLAYGEGVTYWALAEMVRMRARITEGEATEAALAKLRDSIAQHVEDAEERAWLEPRLAHLLGLTERTAPDQQDLFSAWRLFFERLAETSPTVLVFEDLQWADTALVEFVEYLLEWSRSHSLFVVTLARPEVADKHPSWGAGRRDFTSLFLEPLHASAIDDLLHGLVPGLPVGLREQIRDRAEGIPLYAVETVRMLLDRGLLERDGDEYRPVGAIDALEVPETLHALIAARLDGLTPDERRVLEDAAVLGKTFTKDGLSALSGTPVGELEPLLASLVRKEVVTLQSDPRSPERGQYGFLQALVQKVAHDTLSKRERRARHLAAAEFFEATADQDELVEVVAAHYVDAYEADRTAEDASEIKTKARDRLARAGERARSLAANTDALRYFEQAADLADDAAAEAELLERAGEMAFAVGRLDDAASRFERARTVFESLGRTHPAARVAARLGNVRWFQGEIETAIDELEKSYAVLAEDEPDEDLGALAAELARVQYFRGDLDDAARWVESALQIAESLWLPELLSQALNTKSLVLASRGRPEESIALIQHALHIALENDCSDAAIRGYLNLAHHYAVRDRYVDALAIDREGLALARKVGVRREELMFLQHLGGDLYFLGEWDEASDMLAEMRELAPGSRLVEWAAKLYPGPLLAAGRGEPGSLPDDEPEADRQSRAGMDVGRAANLSANGSWVEGLAAAEAAWAARDVLGAHVFTKVGFVLAVEAAFALDDVERVERLLEEVGALPPGQTTPSLRAYSARFEARLAACRGEHERVEPSLEAATSAFRDLGMPFAVAVAQLEHAEWLVARGRPADAVDLLTEARATFERLKAGPWLERLARVATQDMELATPS